MAELIPTWSRACWSVPSRESLEDYYLSNGERKPSPKTSKVDGWSSCSNTYIISKCWWRTICDILQKEKVSFLSWGQIHQNLVSPHRVRTVLSLQLQALSTEKSWTEPTAFTKNVILVLHSSNCGIPDMFGDGWRSCLPRKVQCIPQNVLGLLLDREAIRAGTVRTVPYWSRYRCWMYEIDQVRDLYNSATQIVRKDKINELINISE